MKTAENAWSRQIVRILDMPRFHMDEGIRVSTFPSVQIDSHDWQDFHHQLGEAIDYLDPDKELIRLWPHGDRRLAYAVRRRNSEPEHATIGDYELPHVVWAVRGDGTLYCRFSNLPHSSWAMGELRQATLDDYTEHDWTDVIVWEMDGGTGGDSAEYDLISFLLENRVDLGLAAVSATSVVGVWLTKLGLRIHRTRKSDRAARIAVRRWGNRGFDSPWLLRKWFETKDQWRLPEICKRLQISEVTAKDILAALGYKPLIERRDVWTLSAHSKAVRKRNKWLKAETTEGLNENLY
jgi:hypothetical protein